MKASCALVCLALAHGITASIFNQPERGVEGLEGLDVQQLDYNGHRQLLRDQPKEDQKLKDQTLQVQKNLNQLKNQKYGSQLDQDKTNQLPSRYLPTYQEQYRPSVPLNSQEWPVTHQHSHHSHHHDKNHRHSSSSSQESKESGYYGNQQSIIRGDSQKRISPLAKAVIKSNVYSSSKVDGDVVERNGLKMTVGPDSPTQQTPEVLWKILVNAQKPMRHVEEEESGYYGNQQSIIRGDSQKRISPLAKAVIKSNVYSSSKVDGDVVERNGLKMTVGPDSPTQQTPEVFGKIFANAQKPMRHVEEEESGYYGNQQSIIRGDSQKWISPLAKAVIKSHAYSSSKVDGNVVEWNGLKMTVGPDSPTQTPEDIEKIFGDAQKAMRHVEEEEKVKYNEVFEVATQETNEDAHLNATQLAQKYGYPIEEHIVKTDDGYVLTVFRILPKKQVVDGVKAPVVFLMHGLLGSADDWMLMGPGKSLAYLLSDAGYDVWLGNARGNKYSRRHVTRWPVMADYWQFSIDHIALHDLSAMIDFALETTKQEKLNYIGHALGTTAFFALTATRPEYNTKIIMMYALSPMVYMTKVRSPLMRMISSANLSHERILRQIGNEGFFPSNELIHTLGGALCEKEIGNKMICSNENFVMSGVNVDGMDPNIIPVVLGHLPAGTSAKVIEQYGQGVDSQEFRKFDYGPYINMQVYGTPTAPKYNITEVVAPVTLYLSNEDWLADPTDVVRLHKELPNVKETYMVPEEHFSHMDFQFSSKAPEMVYQRIIESMKTVQEHY